MPFEKTVHPETQLAGLLLAAFTLLQAVANIEGACDRSLLPLVNNADPVNINSYLMIGVTNNTSSGTTVTINTKYDHNTVSNNNNVTTFEEGHVIEYQCHQSFTSIGSPRFSCNNGRFIGYFQCIRTNCTSLASPTHGKVSDISVFNNITKVAFQCDLDYYITGQSTLECDSSGQWSPPTTPSCHRLKCGEYPDRRHGNVSHRLYNNTAGGLDLRFKIDCHPHHILNGQREVSCTENGSWVPSSLGFCKETQCPVTEGLYKHVQIGILHQSQQGTFYDFKCMSDSSISRIGRYIECYRNNSWSNSLAGCYRNCQVDTTFTQNGVILINGTSEHLSFLHGQSFEWLCKDGYKPKSNIPDIITCRNGELNAFPACIIVDNTTMEIMTGDSNTTLNSTYLEKDIFPQEKQNTSDKMLPYVFLSIGLLLLFLISLAIYVCYKRRRRKHAFDLDPRQQRCNLALDVSFTSPERQVPSQVLHGDGADPEVYLDNRRLEGVDSNDIDRASPIGETNISLKDDTSYQNARSITEGETPFLETNDIGDLTAITESACNEHSSDSSPAAQFDKENAKGNKRSKKLKRCERSQSRYKARKRISWTPNDEVHVICDDNNGTEFQDGVQESRSQDGILDTDKTLDESPLDQATEGLLVHTRTDDVVDGVLFIDDPQATGMQMSKPSVESGSGEYKVERGRGKYKRLEKTSTSRYYTAKENMPIESEGEGESEDESENEGTSQGDTSATNLLVDYLPKSNRKGRKGPKCRYVTAKSLENEDNGGLADDSGNDTEPEGNTSATRLLKDTPPKTGIKVSKGPKYPCETANSDIKENDEGRYPEHNGEDIDRYKTAAVSPDELKNMKLDDN